MEKKKGRKKKIRFNYFLKRKIIIGICLFLVFVGGIVTVFAITNKDDKELESNQNEVEKVILAKCPYTLDVIYKRIQENYIDTCRSNENLKQDCDQFSYVVLHFYDYFNKDTKFLAQSTDYFETTKKEYKYYTYDEYQIVFEGFKSIVDVLDSDNNENPNRNYISYASLFIRDFGIYVG